MQLCTTVQPASLCSPFCSLKRRAGTRQGECGRRTGRRWCASSGRRWRWSWRSTPARSPRGRVGCGPRCAPARRLLQFKDDWSSVSAHLLPLQLCQLKFKYKPEQFISRVFGVEEQPEVLVHAVVHVQADYSKARRGRDTVIGTMPGLLPWTVNSQNNCDLIFVSLMIIFFKQMVCGAFLTWSSNCAPPPTTRPTPPPE